MEFQEVRDGKARFSFEGTANKTQKLTKSQCEQNLEKRKQENLPYDEFQKAIEAFSTTSPSV